MEKLVDWLSINMTSLVSMFVGVGVLFLANWFWLKRLPELGAEKKLPRQIGLLALSVLVLLVVVLALPISETLADKFLV